ncbi:VWA domain-containing protein [uncultured Treponema sp.]|uniref:VWA domain-containing protein n=1 Tax=uncultured Treponema sp. TaxID=162155 RepID=UPI002599F8DC|nr:VWA domain-containing protein [uncultured Treponema sp.]
MMRMPVFENPTAFLFLAAIPALFILRQLKIFKKVSFPVVFADWKGKSFVWKGKVSVFFNALSVFLGIAGYISLVCAFADPVIQKQEKIYTSKGADILFVLDTSPSMAARDIANMTRLDAAKQGIRTLVNNNRGAAFGLVAMASEAAAIVPPTVDHELFLRRLDSLVTGGLGEGTALGIGLSSAVYHLIASSAPKKCIVLITDGENNAGSIHPDTAANLAVQNGITVYTFGIGTKGTVPIEYVDPNSGKVHSGYYDSEFDSSSLEEIALAGGGTYFGIESTAAFAEALNSVSRKQNVLQTFHYKSSNRQLYSYFLIFSAIVFFAAWFIRRILLKEI